MRIQVLLSPFITLLPVSAVDSEGPLTQLSGALDSSEVRRSYVIPKYPTEPTAQLSGNIDSSDVGRLLVIPDTHGDILAAAYALYLSFKEIEPNHVLSKDFQLFYKVVTDAIINGVYPDSPLSTATDVGVIQLGDLVDRGPYGEHCLLMFLAVPRLLGWRTWILYGNHEQISMQHSSWDNPYCSKLEESMYGSLTNRDAMYGIGADGEPICPSDEEYYSHQAVFNCETASDKQQCSMWNSLSENFLAAMIRWGFASAAPPTKRCGMHNALNENSLAVVRWGPSSMSESATLFLHAGVSMRWLDDVAASRASATESVADLLDAINEVVRFGLRNLGRLGDRRILSDESPMWDRSLAKQPARVVCEDLLPSILEKFQVTRLIVGHTPQTNMKVNARCGGRLILADAMMSRWMHRVDASEKFLDGANPVVVSMRAASGVNSSQLESMTVLYYDERRVDRNMHSRQDNVFRDKMFGRIVASSMGGGGVVREAPGGVVNYNASAVDPLSGPEISNARDIEELASILEVPLSIQSGIVYIPGECLDSAMMERQHVPTILANDAYISSIFGGIDAVVNKAHAHGYRIGFTPEYDVMDNFCITPSSSSERIVKLVNWIAVAKATPEELAEEFAEYTESMEYYKWALQAMRDKAAAGGSNPNQ